MAKSAPTRSKSRIKIRAGSVRENAEHTRLKTALKDIARSSGFKFDTEVVLNFTGNLDPRGHLVAERSIDVAAFTSSRGKSTLLIFECKGGVDLKEVNKHISAWEADIKKIQRGKTKIIYSQENSLQETDLPTFGEIRVCYVFGRGIDPERYTELAKILHSRSFYSWDAIALSYYTKTAGTIRKAAKYQILREFEVTLDSDGLYEERAIRISQGKLDMFVFGAKPSTLLKIGYVYRRASGKPSAYQRIVSAERIERISAFLRSKDALLPNAIIIAFDDEDAVQKYVSYDEKDGKLYFPRRYCSAWIIDGQHRVFGFLDTKYESDEDDPDPIFKLPIVAFKNMDIIPQNRTFVSINYNQKKIDTNLLCDLATEFRDLNNELTWPSLLITELNKLKPLKDKIKISELHKGRPVTITSFARFGLLESLLGYDRKSRSYKGPLHAYAPLHPAESVDSTNNRASMARQVELLKRYFVTIHHNTSRPNYNKDPWLNTKKYSLLKPTGINALLLVLSRIMEKYPHLEADMHQGLEAYLRPLKKVTFTRSFVVKQGGGWKGFRKFANVILRKLNDANRDTLRLFGQREKI